MKQTRRRNTKPDPFDVKLMGIMLTFVAIMLTLVVLSCWG